RYRKQGITALSVTPRSDKGKLRKVTAEEVMEAIRALLPKFHLARPTRAALYRMAIEEGWLSRSSIAPNTFSRIVKEYEMLKPEDEHTHRRRRAFAKAHANEMWQADTMFGPYVSDGNGHTQSKLIAFLDDASRVCVHGQFFLRENVDSLIEALSSAFYKRGLPESLYVDNGSIYTSKEIIQICARVGCLLTHTPVRDGASKGKIERFFRSVRDGFLIRKLDLSSIEALNRQFIQWVEEEYNARKHSVLGMSPLDRFALDRRRIRYLPPNEVHEELFFVEEDRVVRADNTFSFQSLRYEAPRHLPNRKVQVRFERRRPHRKVVVFYKGDRMGEARPVDFTRNDRHPSRTA
ncbi:MAG: DDE-type integrase/transposase/recombinase, partial [Nitrosopumilus sp.]|nr:DDE-type integrase/transposase/recombinase [Nitrosopumilus sp.]